MLSVPVSLTERKETSSKSHSQHPGSTNSSCWARQLFEGVDGVFTIEVSLDAMVVFFFFLLA